MAEFVVPLALVCGNMKVRCRYCSALFRWQRLEHSDEIDVDGDDANSESICPRCGKPDCCDIMWKTWRQ